MVNVIGKPSEIGVYLWISWDFMGFVLVYWDLMGLYGIYPLVNVYITKLY